MRDASFLGNIPGWDLSGVPNQENENFPGGLQTGRTGASASNPTKTPSGDLGHSVQVQSPDTSTLFVSLFYAC